jgi:hypothetical protein
MSEIVIVSPKAGDSYHRIGENGRAECGVLNQATAKRMDGPVVTWGDDVVTTSSDAAAADGFEKCGRCFDE